MSRALVVLAVLCTASSAAADHRFDRNPAITVPVDRSDRSRPLTERKDAPPPRPEITGDLVMKIQGLVAGLREEKIALFEQLLAETDDGDPEKAGFWFQLAEVRSEQHRYYRLLAVEHEIEKRPKKAKAAAKLARAELKAAIKAFQALAADDAYRNYALMDRALFLYGYMLQSAGEMEAARAVYQRLAKEYPASPHVAAARFAFGEYYFEKGELTDAAAEYRAVLDLPDSIWTTHARFKLGWVALNLGRPDDALAAFYQVALETAKDKGDAPLHRAATRDLVRAYAEVGNAEKAHKYFKKVDKKLAFEMLERLGELYLEQGKAAKAIYTFRELISLDGKHARVCLWQYDVAHAMLTVGTNDQKVTEIEKLVDLHAALKKRKGISAENLDACHDDAAAMSGDLARAYHSEWSKTQDPDTVEHAARLYRAYLEHFPDAPDRGETAYYQAELLWARAAAETKARLQVERWEAAAAAFTAVVHAGDVDATLIETSAAAAVEAWVNADHADPRSKLTPPTPDLGDDAAIAPTPQPLPDREQRLLAAIADYRKLAKPDPDVLGEVKFLEAAVQRRFDRLAEAVPVLADIVEHHRAHPRGSIAIDLLLHSLNRLGRHDEMLGWVEQLLDDRKLVEREPELADRLRRLDHQGRRKRAERCDAGAKASGDDRRYVRCGELYVELWNRDPDVDAGDELLWNGAFDFERGDSIGAAIELYENLTRLYPKSPLAARSLVRLGDAYARIAWYRESAEKLETYARLYAGEADAYDALSDAVFYRKGIGDDEEAIDDTRAFVARYGNKKPAEAADAFYSMASVLEKQGKPDEVVAHLRRYLKTFGDHGGVPRKVAAWSRIGQLLWAQSCPVATVDGSCVEVVRERAVRGRGKKRARQRTQCGPAEKIHLKLVERDARLVKDALKAFREAIAIQDKAASKDPLARSSYAIARLHLAEQAYETFLARRFPSDLDFDEKNPSRARKSIARFEAWAADKVADGKVARERYEAMIFEVKEPAQAIAAAARIGQIQQHFAAQLFTAPIPTSVRGDQDAADVYCDRLVELAMPLEDKALEAYGACLETSTKLGWFSEWSRLCERELGQLRPEEYPTAAELRATPDAVGTFTALEARPRL